MVDAWVIYLILWLWRPSERSQAKPTESTRQTEIEPDQTWRFEPPRNTGRIDRALFTAPSSAARSTPSFARTRMGFPARWYLAAGSRKQKSADAGNSIPRRPASFIVP